MRIGLVYDLFEDYPWQTHDAPDSDAEYEPIETILALESGIRVLGHKPVRIGTARKLLEKLPSLSVDVALTISESYGSRNREAHAPILLELAGIPHLGSDALTLSLSLDKAWTKDLATIAGVPTPPYQVFSSESDINIPITIPFPLFVKPRYEGTAKGITPQSKVFTPEELQQQVNQCLRLYQQDILVETFIEGSEYTVAVMGNNPPHVLPVLQRATETKTGIGLHALERKGVPQQHWQYQLSGNLDATLEASLQQLALKVYQKLECLDFARLDFRVDKAGNPWFLEINTLPTFDPTGTFAILAELMDMPYEAFIADVLQRGLKRLGLAQ